MIKKVKKILGKRGVMIGILMGLIIYCAIRDCNVLEGFTTEDEESGEDDDAGEAKIAEKEEKAAVEIKKKRDKFNKKSAPARKRANLAKKKMKAGFGRFTSWFKSIIPPPPFYPSDILASPLILMDNVIKKRRCNQSDDC